MKFIFKHIIILIILCSPAAGFTQLLDIENFTTSEYLGRSDFYSFTQDSNLELYFSSNKGIIRYNSDKFSEIRISPEIDNNPVGQLSYYNNSLYFSTSSAVFQYNLENSSLHKIFDKPATDFNLFDGNLYFSAGKSIYKINPKQLTAALLYEDDTHDLTCFYINEEVTIAGTTKGLRIIKKGQLKEVVGTFINAKAIKAENDTSLLILSKNALFTFSLEQNLSKNKITRVALLKREEANQLFQSQIGNAYISTLSGNLYQYSGVFDEDNLIRITEKNGLKKFPIHYLANDKELNLWVLGADGLTKISINQPVSILSDNNIRKIFNHENSVLIAQDYQIKTYDFSLKPSVFRIKQKIKESSAIYINNEWWVTVNNKYLYKINRNKIQVELNTLELNFVQSIGEDKFLALNSEGRMQLYNSQNTILNELEELQTAPHFIKGTSTHYVVSDNNVYHVNQNGALTKTDIKIEENLPLKYLRASELGLWSCKDNILLLHKSDGRIIDFSSSLQNHLSGNKIYDVFEDSQNNLWLSLNNHIAQIDFINENDSLIVNEVSLFGEKDHVKNSYFTDAIELENQQIWFINSNAITIYNPLLDNPQLVAPGIYIESAYVINYDEFNDPKDTLLLDDKINTISNKHEIVIEPNIVSFYKKHKSILQYRNVTAGGVWLNIPASERVRLRNLLDGENIIELRAITRNGITSNKTLSYHLNVQAPLWKRDWFYGSAILSVLLLGFVGYRSINSYKNNKTKELNEKLDEKLGDLERRSHLQILKSERLKQLNELITSQKSELEKKNKQIESQKYELSLTNDQIKKQKDLLEDTGNKLKASINYAQRIQNALMSTEVEVKKAIDDSFIYFMPRDVVSGDFYWFNKVKNEAGEELLILAAVDCTGHGVPGAIVSVMGINLLNNITNLKGIYKPGQILNELNTDIINNLRQNETQVNDGMDMSIVTINNKTKTIEFAGAKNPLMYVEDGELIRIRGDKHAIGGQQRGEERAFQTHTLNCSDGKNRTFFLFSDGYQDQFGGEKGFKFLTSNFKNLLLEIHNLPVLEQKTILHERLEDWKGEYSQTDDILVIGFKF